MDLTGFDSAELERYLADLDVKPGLTDEDDASANRRKHLSASLVICGCSESIACCAETRRRQFDVERLMAGEKADLVFTDPPYNVDYSGYTKDKFTIQKRSE